MNARHPEALRDGLVFTQFKVTSLSAPSISHQTLYTYLLHILKLNVQMLSPCIQLCNVSGFCKRIKNVPVWYENQSPSFFLTQLYVLTSIFVLLGGSYSSCCLHNSQLTAFENRKPFLTLLTDVFLFFYLLYPLFFLGCLWTCQQKDQSKWWFWARRLGNVSEGKHSKTLQRQRLAMLAFFI